MAIWGKQIAALPIFKNNIITICSLNLRIPIFIVLHAASKMIKLWVYEYAYEEQHWDIDKLYS